MVVCPRSIEIEREIYIYLQSMEHIAAVVCWYYCSVLLSYMYSLVLPVRIVVAACNKRQKYLTGSDRISVIGGKCMENGEWSMEYVSSSSKTSLGLLSIQYVCIRRLINKCNDTSAELLIVTPKASRLDIIRNHA